MDILAPLISTDKLSSRHKRSQFGVNDKLKEVLLYNTSDLEYFRGFVTAEQLSEYKASDEIPRFIYFQAIIESHGGIDQAFEEIFSSLVKSIHVKFSSPMYPAFFFFYLYTKGVFIPQLQDPIHEKTSNEDALAYFQEKYLRLKDFLTQHGATFHDDSSFSCDDIDVIKHIVASTGLKQILGESLQDTVAEHASLHLGFKRDNEWGFFLDSDGHHYEALDYLLNEKNAAQKGHDARIADYDYDKQQFLKRLLDDFIYRNHDGSIDNNTIGSNVMPFFHNGLRHLMQYIKTGGSIDAFLDMNNASRKESADRLSDVLSDHQYPGFTEALETFYRPLESPKEKMVFFNTRLEEFLRVKRELYKDLVPDPENN